MSTAEVRSDYAKLIEPTRIHGSLYTEPGVFQDEMDRIWHRGWVYVGHESEVRAPGDYCRKTIGLQPIIMTRDEAGEVHLLMNRCSHRGNRLCDEETGNSHAFRCPYHGWTFDNSGALIGVPFNTGYESMAYAKEHFGLGRVPRVASYRGFVFGSLAPDGPSLRDHLGLAADALDRLADLSPAGEIEIRTRWIKHWVHANWKLVLENETDGYHPPFVHQSVYRAVSAGSREKYFRGSTTNVVKDLRQGHAELDFRPEYRRDGSTFQWFGRIAESRLPAYLDAMQQRYGDAARQKLVDGPPHVLVFPNLFIAELNLLVIQPVNPTETIQLEAPVLLKGAPELDSRILRRFEGGFGPAGALGADDAVMYERNQSGLEASQPDWIELVRGLHREREEGGAIVSEVTDETTQRGFWQHYRSLMTGQAANR